MGYGEGWFEEEVVEDDSFEEKYDSLFEDSEVPRVKFEDQNLFNKKDLSSWELDDLMTEE